MISIRARLLLAATLVLAGFVLATAAALDRAFEDRALQTQFERLQGLAYLLLAAAEPTADGGLTISTLRLPERRLENPGSGLEAALLDDRNALVWGSVSLSSDFPLLPEPAPGEWLSEVHDQRFVVALGLRWDNPLEGAQRYTLAVMEDRGPFKAQMREYRRTLWTWLGVAAAALLSVQGSILAWSLAPLARLSRDLRRVEQGEQSGLMGRYPAELQPLSEAINALINTSHAQLARQRHALDDLAHSLKTPLAVLRAYSEEPERSVAERQALAEPLDRMQAIVDEQLRRAVMAGRRALSEPVALQEPLDKLARSLTKVYASKEPRFEWAIPPGFKLRMDGGDLFELFGNLLENAVKYGNGRVRVSARRLHPHYEFTVEDDGPGFPPEPERLLARGVRADTRTSGQGIGLAASHELVKAYRGSLQLERSEALGGACVRIRLPV